VEKETEVARELLRKGQRPKVRRTRALAEVVAVADLHCVCCVLCTTRQALLALKKKRFQEQLLTKSEAQLSNLQEMVRHHTHHRTYTRTAHARPRAHARTTAHAPSMRVELIERLSPATT
jgi:hypothetical protein